MTKNFGKVQTYSILSLMIDKENSIKTSSMKLIKKMIAFYKWKRQKLQGTYLRLLLIKLNKLNISQENQNCKIRACNMIEFNNNSN